MSPKKFTKLLFFNTSFFFCFLLFSLRDTVPWFGLHRLWPTGSFLCLVVRTSELPLVAGSPDSQTSLCGSWAEQLPPPAAKSKAVSSEIIQLTFCLQYHHCELLQYLLNLFVKATNVTVLLCWPLIHFHCLNSRVILSGQSLQNQVRVFIHTL